MNFEAKWCKDEPWVNLDLQYSPWTKFRGRHHYPSYNIFCNTLWRVHQDNHFFQGFEMKVPILLIYEFHKFGDPWFFHFTSKLRAFTKKLVSPSKGLFKYVLRFSIKNEINMNKLSLKWPSKLFWWFDSQLLKWP